MKRLLPQANNLSTVIDVFIYVSSMKNWNLNDVADFCKFETRQASYYINACHYLGLLNKDGSLSEVGKCIIDNPSKIKENIYELVICDKLISKIFARLLIEGENDIKDYTKNLLSLDYPTYSLAVIERRTSTILNWCFEVKKAIRK